MRFNISNEPAFWVLFFLFFVPSLYFSFTKLAKELLCSYQIWLIRICFCVVLYVMYIFYVVQEGSKYGGN